MTKHFSIVLLAALLQGCVTQLSNLPESKPLAYPSHIAGTKAVYVHKPSHYAFPSVVAGFKRVSLLQYDTAGLDISAGYQGGALECALALTIYVYTAAHMSFLGANPDVVRSLEANWLRSGYTRAKQDIVAAHPAAVLQREDSTAENGRIGKKAVYLFHDRTSELYMFVVEHRGFLE